MKVLLVLDTLSAGGAEIFAMKWASELNGKSNHSVEILVLNKRLNRYETIARHLKNAPVTYVFRSVLVEKIVLKLDGVFRRLGIQFSIKDKRSISKIRKQAFGKDIVHSHLFNVDLICALALQKHKIKHFTTVHGDYLRYSEDHENGNCRIVNFRQKLNFLISHIDGFVCISDKQVNFFNSENPDLNIIKIYNGYGSNLMPIESPKTSPPFKFVMVSRGIAEKGWQQVIDAFNSIDLPDAELHLIGESHYISDLKKSSHNQNIVFRGFNSDPIHFLKTCHVGLLPSYYRSESLPTVVIEYLLTGLPVIATNIGEIFNMLNFNNKSAGIVIGLKDGSVEVSELSKAMQTMYEDENLRTQLEKNTFELAKRFDLEFCISSYLEFYQAVK